MTDKIAVLTACQQAGIPLFSELLQHLSEQWQCEPLVMDKCFSLAAANPAEQVYTAIEQLTQHSLFSWKNPNRVRAVFSAFSLRNPQQFHRKDGKGYRLLSEVICRLDKLNPQIAARLVTPLLSWRRFDTGRQEILQSQLQYLAEQPGLSDDLYEKISRSLSDVGVSV